MRINMHIIRICDIENNHLTFDLKDILPVIDDYRSRAWLVWNIDCFGSEWYEVLTDAPNQQMILTSNQIHDYAYNVGQTIDGYFAAIKYNINSKDIPLIKQEKDLYDISDFIIKAVDSTYFEVISSDMEVINKLKNRFKDVIEMS